MIKVKHRIEITGSDLKIREHVYKKAAYRWNEKEMKTLYAVLTSAFASVAQLIRSDDLYFDVVIYDVAKPKGTWIWRTGRIPLPTFWLNQQELEKLEKEAGK